MSPDEEKRFGRRIHHSGRGNKLMRMDCSSHRSYGVMAITLDFESNNPSSNLGRTSYFFLCLDSRSKGSHLVHSHSDSEDISAKLNTPQGAPESGLSNSVGELNMHQIEYNQNRS